MGHSRSAFPELLHHTLQLQTTCDHWFNWRETGAEIFDRALSTSDAAVPSLLHEY
jgi:hypothetical protein